MKKNKLINKTKELMEEVREISVMIEGYEAGIIAMTGYKSEDLVTKVVEGTGKFDKDNKEIKITKYVPTDIVVYNEADNCYYITEPQDATELADAVDTIENPVESNVQPAFGSDFDLDTDNLNNVELL